MNATVGKMYTDYCHRVLEEEEITLGRNKEKKTDSVVQVHTLHEFHTPRRYAMCI